MHTFVHSLTLLMHSIVVAVFMETIQKLHGKSKIIVCDRDPIFTIKFWTKLFSCLVT